MWHCFRAHNGHVDWSSQIVSDVSVSVSIVSLPEGSAKEKDVWTSVAQCGISGEANRLAALLYDTQSGLV